VHLSEDEFYERLTQAFSALEECAREGAIQWYGTATWDGYRVPQRAPNYLSLESVLKAAEAAGGKEHRFRCVQLPFNFQLVEALVAHNQRIGDREGSLLEAAYEYGVTVFTSVPLMQGRLVGRIAPEARTRFPGLETDAQRLIQFARSAPGICAPLVGMSRVAHVEETAKVAAVPPLSEAEFNAFFGR
jgi:aryl-alcohol dehydrogenase-like predicted oxidoreductase